MNGLAYVSMCCECMAHTCHGTCVEVRGQLEGAHSLSTRWVSEVELRLWAWG